MKHDYPGVTEEDMDMLLHKDTMSQSHVRATQNAENMGLDVTDDVLIIDLTRNEAGCGLGLIDGLVCIIFLHSF